MKGGQGFFASLRMTCREHVILSEAKNPCPPHRESPGRYPIEVSDRISSSTSGLRLLFIFRSYLQVQFSQLLFIDRRVRIHHQINRALCLGEGDYLANIVHVCEEHHQAINAQGYAAVRRGAIFKRLEHMPKL